MLMTYQEILPPPVLQPYIHQFLLLKHDDNAAGVTMFKVFADGFPGLIFQQNAGSFFDSSHNPLPQLFVHGLTTRYSEKTAKGGFYNIAVRLKPYALKPVFGIDANQLTDKYIALDDLVKNALADRLSRTQSLNDRISILAGFFIDRISANREEGHWKAAQIITKIRSNDDHSLSNIRATLRISERSLERIMKTYVGVPPKLYQRIGRFQNALDHLFDNPPGKLTDLAHTCSYTDQSHYIRDFKTFAGIKPGEFQRKGLSLLRNFPQWR